MPDIGNILGDAIDFVGGNFQNKQDYESAVISRENAKTQIALQNAAAKRAQQEQMAELINSVVKVLVLAFLIVLASKFILPPILKALKE